jgi:NADH-quinone oxidoreductase subunit M
LGIGSALFPFHHWYIAAQRHASPPARVLISAVLLNIGCCGLIRFCLPAFPLAATRFAPAIILFGALGLVYGAIKALQQPAFPAMLAYWNVAQVNLALIGIFSLQDLGLHGAILLAFARALCTATLLLVEPPGEEQQTSPIRSANLDTAGGRPVRTLGFVSALAILGSLGFVAQGTLVMGLTRWHWQTGNLGALATIWDWLWYALVAFGLLVSAWALLRSCGHLISSSGHPRQRRHTLLVIPLLLVALLVAVRPALFSDMVGPTVYRLLVEVMSASEAAQDQNTSPADTPDQVPTPPSDQTDTTLRLPAPGDTPPAGIDTIADGQGGITASVRYTRSVYPFFEVSLA